MLSEIRKGTTKWSLYQLGNPLETLQNPGEMMSQSSMRIRSQFLSEMDSSTEILDILEAATVRSHVQGTDDFLLRTQVQHLRQARSLPPHIPVLRSEIPIPDLCSSLDR